MHEHSLAQQNLGIPATDRVDAKKSLTVDMTNNQADLIAVSIEKDRLCALRIDGGKHISVHVGGDNVSERSDKFSDDFLNSLFSPGGSGGFEQFPEQSVCHFWYILVRLISAIFRLECFEETGRYD
jgi:hypothetical protein